MISKYELKARIFPAVITILPILIFSHFYLYRVIPELLNSIILTKIIGDVSVAAVLLYFVTQLSRFISKKYLQDNLFRNELYFPTTNYLLFSDKKYTYGFKDKIRNKIKNDFGIILLNAKQENNDTEEARRKINEAIGLIRAKIKSGRLLLQHNIEYGFVRNLIGGTLISFPFSIFSSLFFFTQKNKELMITSAVLVLFYGIIGFSQIIVLRYFASNYADVLFNEYLSE